MFWFIYHLPLYVIPLSIVAGILLCTTALYAISFLSENAVRILGFVAFIISVGGILAITLINRSHGNYDIILKPFHSFIEAKEQVEMYRTMLMNVFLFVPLGLSTPYVFSKTLKASRIIIMSLVLAFAFSFAVEFMQFALHIGRCETDDVLCNTLGAFLGNLSFAFYKYLKRKKTNISVRILSAIYALIFICLIFAFSHQPGGSSDYVSISFAALLFGKDFNIAMLINSLIREIAHAVEYAALAFAVYLFTATFEKKLSFNYIVTLLFSVLYAVSDEVHQYFIPGRACEVYDVVVDSLGAVLCITVMYFIHKSIINKLNKKSEF